jgi:hypothetical protein
MNARAVQGLATAVRVAAADSSTATLPSTAVLPRWLRISVAAAAAAKWQMRQGTPAATAPKAEQQPYSRRVSTGCELLIAQHCQQHAALCDGSCTQATVWCTVASIE